MPAQGTALGTGAGVENSNALKGQNRFVVKNLVSPFQGWADSHSDRIPRAMPWAFLFRPLRGGRKAQLQNCKGGGRGGGAAGGLDVENDSSRLVRGMQVELR